MNKMAGLADDGEEKSTRWRRLGQLTPEEALLASGASAESVKAVISHLGSSGPEINSELLDALSRQLGVDDAKGVLLAMLGRGDSPIKSLRLIKHHDRDFLDQSQALALCVNLTSNSGIESVVLVGQNCFGTSEGCEVLGNALAMNKALKCLHLSNIRMGPEAVKLLMIGLRKNRSLQELAIGKNPLSDEGVGYVSQMLKCNSTLTFLNLHNTNCGFMGAQHVADALKNNNSLLHLLFGANEIKKAGMSLLMDPFIHDGEVASPKNVTLRHLELGDTSPNDFCVESLVQAIRTNKAWSSLGLGAVHLETRQWVDQIIPALEANHTLKSLDVTGCRGLTVEGALDAFMHLVQSNNTGLKEIDTKGTALFAKSVVLHEELRWKRSATSVDEMTVRWKKLGQLGMEDALRESNASSTSIRAVLRLLNAGDEEISSELLSTMAECLGVDDRKSVLLATLGRGESSINSLRLENNRGQNSLTEEEALALCVNLASNPNIVSANLTGQEVFGTRRVCDLVGNALATNKVLQALHLSCNRMGPESVKLLLKGLERNTTLHYLDLDANPLFDEGVGYVAQMLRSNTSLTTLQLGGISCGFTGAQLVSDALKNNNTLLAFQFGGNAITKAGMTLLMNLFIHDGDGASSGNATISLLDLEQMESPDHISVESLARAIRTNKSLSKLSLLGAPLESRDWVDTLIPALKDNDTLKTLDLRYCGGLTEDVFEALMSLVQFSNTGLEFIHVSGTNISLQGGLINEELRKNKEYRGRLRHQATVTPRSGRVVLCGYEFAGKTSICRTIRQVEDSPQSNKRKLAWKKFLQRHPLLRQLLYGRRAYLETQDRTRGFDILTVGKEEAGEGENVEGVGGAILTSIWDFAGQREFYVLHDYLFPNSGNSCFLYVCSARCYPDHHGNRAIKDVGKMKDEFRFWLRFIASNSRLVQEGVRGGQRRLPEVTFVLTNRDTLTAKDISITSQQARRVVTECKEEFESVISLTEEIDVIDAHSPADVERVFAKLQQRLAGILEQSTEYAVCESVRRALQGWAAANRLRGPLLSVGEFDVMCNTEVRQALSQDQYRAAQLSTRAGRETVLAYLNDVGEIIFVVGLPFIVVNPRWFGVGLLGHLIDAFGESREAGKWNRGVLGCFRPSKADDSWWLDHQHGFVSRNEIGHLLRNSLKEVKISEIFSTHNLIDLMIHLEMCFEERPTTSRSRFFIPALFNGESDVEAGEGKRQLRWEVHHPHGESIHYLGRRLECENASLTFLTPGFFPRLQVVIRNYLHAQEWIQNIGFDVARNLIRFVVNGMEVQVEYSGDIDYFVDILIKSSASRETTLRFLQEHVVNKILEFCASPQGCQGVRLAEAVIRPFCVRFLSLCRDRKLHAVRVSTLVENINESGNAYKHTWKQCIENVSDMDFALDLLHGEASYKRFIAASQIDQADGSLAGSRPASVFTGRPDQSRSQIRLPTRFFPTISDVSFITKLESKMNLAKVIPIKLHLMCDGIGMDGPHEVEDQPGRTMKLNGEFGGFNLPILKYAVRLLWIGVKVTGGMVLHVPTIREVDDWVQTLFNEEEVPITVSMLKRIVGGSNSASTRTVPSARILDLLAKYMTIDPETEWLNRFLNLTDSQKFHADFRLRKVESTGDELDVRWLCQSHFETGIREGRVKSVPH